MQDPIPLKTLHYLLLHHISHGTVITFVMVTMPRTVKRHPYVDVAWANVNQVAGFFNEKSSKEGFAVVKGRSHQSVRSLVTGQKSLRY